MLVIPLTKDDYTQEFFGIADSNDGGMTRDHMNPWALSIDRNLTTAHVIRVFESIINQN
jgi:hypothetical protein